MAWRSRQKYDKAVLSMIYLSGEGESGALNVKGNFHRAPHRGAGVIFGPSARSLPTRAIAHRRRDSISSSSIAGPLSERVLATVRRDEKGRIIPFAAPRAPEARRDHSCGE